MKIDTLGVQAFIAVADRGSFQGAADALHVTQTAITQRLRKLEDFLGVTLIERTTRSIALTEIGRDFLPQARRLLGELADALVEIRETGIVRRGDVSIACVPTVGVQYLPRILQAYSARYPHNRIRILDHASSAVVEAVLRREAEFGINIAGERHPELASVPLTEDRYVLICHEDHPLAKRRRIAWKQLQPYPLIFAGEVSGNRVLLDQALKASHLALRSFYEVQRSSTAVGLVAQGVGAAVVPRLAIQKGAYPTVRMIELTHPVVSRTLALVARKTGHLSPAAQALYDMILEQATLAR
ncbi:MULTISPECIES: LysR family transcriptional regulator [Paraburkholderia]|uniref:Transcriptional regulator, LysR family n=1 Tax=Paraburkholderia megapolitana TaxID=420953 RepID=A0A1I3IPY6_9BURK|nr:MULTISPECIES: LysR family transcriptional regulator [Paraburkholderia]MCX4161048.1 LysR substrate-binding domain-containing protein [Paraburkholderia megapolitana]MDN7156544.1 LysR substrate-binding domain-containing protein [Paraburkholderia sp. CHISQ3]MDQ6493589.1 LysR substrate-binding domain-containing protein [Paraburkholderia megapolitana]QDQ85097.1 LysR family transcriptional regulator [Paraburkholderia megapolitana]SFI50016.1 transcriptional regulator, LysR family [Paraburkholderia 